MNEKNKMAYLAGLIDGDGSLSIGKLKGALNPLYFPLIQFGTSRDVLADFLKETFGGNRIVGKPRPMKSGEMGFPYHQWRCRSAENVKSVLDALIPYLKIKKERAVFLLKFIDKFKFIRGKSLSSDESFEREQYYVRMINYNSHRSEKHDLVEKRPIRSTDDSTFWSYVAGLMDTDGSFSIKRQKPSHLSPRYNPVIQLSMTDCTSLNFFLENCNLGKVYLPRNKACTKKFHFHLGLYSKRECIEFIDRVSPFLIAKKEAAAVLKEFCENFSSTKYGKGGVSEEEGAYREFLHQKLCCLNKHGVYKPTLIDLEARKPGDRAEGESHRERLNERDPKGCAKV